MKSTIIFLLSLALVIIGIITSGPPTEMDVSPVSYGITVEIKLP